MPIYVIVIIIFMFLLSINGINYYTQSIKYDTDFICSFIESIGQTIQVYRSIIYINQKKGMSMSTSSSANMIVMLKSLLMCVWTCPMSPSKPAARLLPLTVFIQVSNII